VISNPLNNYRTLHLSTSASRTASRLALLSTLGWAGQAHAQNFNLPTGSALAVPALGGTTVNSQTNGGDSTRSNGSSTIVRPALPAAPLFSTSLEYESWDSGTEGGFTRLSGNRLTGLFNYAHGGLDKTEVSISVPFQRVEIDGLGNGRGVGDIGLAFRKYFYSDVNPNSLTIVASLRAFLPTGDETRGLGVGRTIFGPSLSFSKPFGNSTLLYSGVGYNFASGRSLGISLEDAGYAWIGGVTRFGNRLGLQYDATYFKTPFDEDYTRVLVGPQLYLTPTQAVQLNFRKELKAAGKPFGVSLGYSSNF
jgi:hypothetical protein